MNSVLVTKVSSIKQTLNILIDLAVNVQKIFKKIVHDNILCESVVAVSVWVNCGNIWVM